ncbi:hypothetical protein HOLleu_33172 [Holothuria leucospilota]|uniref:Uncharacterized protein n=1 Tax=Holothuria leucospilota TaxID=206669 RepID=A0A9Q1BHX9_HOLLE|nr:hypothetical protein HOLleu_33172 [Holothuria leucospilota]
MGQGNTAAICLTRCLLMTVSSKDIPTHTQLAIFFNMMLRESKEDLTKGLYIRFQTDGGVFNLRRLLALTNTLEELILDLLFAYNCALLAHNEVKNFFRQLSTALQMQQRPSAL